MFTYHPTAKRTHNGYVPMVIVPIPRGNAWASKVSKRTFPYADTAERCSRVWRRRVLRNS